MWLIVLGFLVWLFATGKSNDWLALMTAPASTGSNGKTNQPQNVVAQNPYIGNIGDAFNSIYNPNPSTQGWSGRGQWDSVMGAFSNMGQGFTQATTSYDSMSGGGN